MNLRRKARGDGREAEAGCLRGAISTSRLSPLAPSLVVRAFTLMEVMIALAIFFMCIFGILELVSQNLRTARMLQKPRVDIGSLAAQLTLTNKLEEGVATGDFGELYPNCSWRQTATQIASNGLFQIDFVVTDTSSGNAVESKLSVMMYKPDSTANLGLPRQSGRLR